MILEQNIIKAKDSTIGWIHSKKNLMTLFESKDDVLPYAYPCENYIKTILSNKLVRKALQGTIDRYYSHQIEDIQATGQEVTSNSYPELYRIVNECYERLNMVDKPLVMISPQLKGVNALTVGTDKKPIILLSRKAVIQLSDGELKFLIGHECGHVLQQNLVCHTVKGLLDNLKNSSEIVGEMVADTINVPLNQWHRCSEITADRTGLLCCKDFNYAKQVLSSTECHLDRLGCDATKGSFQGLLELDCIHPMLKKRLLALEKFERSDALNTFYQKKMIDRCSIVSLNRKVQIIID